MTVVLAIVAGIFAWKWLKWKIVSEAAVYWILKRYPDFTAEDLSEAWADLVREAL